MHGRVHLSLLLLCLAVPVRASAGELLDRDVELLSHVDLSKRLEARERVRAAGSDAVPALLKVIRGSRSKDPYKFQAALYLLGEIGDPAATKDLLRVARDSISSTRRQYWALASLAKIGAPEAVDLARERLGHEDGSTRRAAAFVLLAQKPEDSVPVLLEGLRSGSADVRDSCAFGLRHLSGVKQGFDPRGDAEAREAAVKRWEKWWEDKKEFPPAPPEMPEMARHEEPGCVVWTDGGEERAREIATKTIVLRRAFAEWFGVRTGGVPTRVREFRNWDDFHRYGSLNQWGFVIVSEFFYSSFLHEVVTFRTGTPAIDDKGLVHETFHDFYHRHSDVQLPWFNEGMAEYFETWRLEDGELAPGPRNPEWLEIARGAARSATDGFLGPLVSAGQQEFYFASRSRNYAWSWAIVDHLVRTDAGRTKLKRIFRLLREGRKPAEISRKVFGKKDLKAMEQAIRDLGGEDAPDPGDGEDGGERP